MQDRRSIKIEIPLPSRPALRRLRFSLKSLAVLVALIAVGLAIFNYATESERARHHGRYVSYVISGPTGAETGTGRINQNLNIRSFVNSRQNMIEQWPPTIWVKRVDISSPDLEKRIDIRCSGTREHPTYHAELELQSGDVIFIDAGRMKTTAAALHDIPGDHGVAVDAAGLEMPTVGFAE